MTDETSPTRKPAKGPGSAATGGGRNAQMSKKFAEVYCQTGNATDAAREAGYADPEKSGYKLLRQQQARAHIDAILKLKPSAAIATRSERLEILSSIARGETPEVRNSDRINACNLIAKMNGELIAKTQLTGFDGKPLTVGIEGVPLQDLLAMFKGTNK